MDCAHSYLRDFTFAFLPHTFLRLGWVESHKVMAGIGLPIVEERKLTVKPNGTESRTVIPKLV